MPAAQDHGAVMQAAISRRAEIADHKSPGKTIAHSPAPRAKQKRRAQGDVIAGAISGAVARFLIGPLDVLKIRFQVQVEPISAASRGTSKYTSIAQAFRLIVKEEGIKARAHPHAMSTPFCHNLVLHVICHGKGHRALHIRLSYTNACFLKLTLQEKPDRTVTQWKQAYASCLEASTKSKFLVQIW